MKNPKLQTTSEILAQSQLQRAIELTSAIGFPVGIDTFESKADFITRKLTKALIQTTLDNADFAYKLLNKENNNG